MYPMDPERHSHQREYGEPETCSHQREYEEPERCSQRMEYREPERCSQRMEYREPETCSQQMEYREPETCSQRMEYREPETCSQQMEYREPETCSQQMEYREPETCSQRREYEEPETCSQRREYEEPETCSQRREYEEPERCSQRREYEEPERCSQRREYGEPETCSQWREYEEPERCSQQREYEEPERCSQQREYREPETCSKWREYGEPERCSQRREYREPSSGQWGDGLETRDNGQAMAREPYSEYSSMGRTREGWEEYGSSSDMSFIMDPSSRDWSEDSLRGSGAPFSPDTDGDVDGDPLELSVEDLELLRKRMELEIIEEQIARKKAVLAMELVGPESKAIRKQKTKDKDLEMLTKNVSNKDVTLKERVNSILRKRAWTNECRSKEAANQQVPPKLVLHPPKVVKSFVERMNESILHKDSIVKGSLTLDIHEEEHPLKLKVEALLEQRRNPTVYKEDKAAKGFQYFLDVLNKGVDIDRLSKIVNNFKDLPSMGEELPQGQPPPLDGQPETNSKSERKVPSRKRRSRFDEFPLGCFNILGVQPNPFGDLLREVVPAGSVLPQHCSLLQSGGGEIGQHSLSLGFIQAMDSPKNKKPKSTQVEEKRKGRYKSKSPPVEQKRKGRHTSKSPPVEEKRKGRHKSKSPPVEETRKGRLKSKSPPVEEKRKGRLKSKSPPVEEKRKGRLKSKSPPVEEKRKGRLKSKSPPVEENRKERPEDEQKYGQIQSLLQTIGLDLGVEELGRLNDRIQERLYGKKRDLEKKVGKKESVWGVEKEESKNNKEESKKDKEENKKDKEESKKDKEENKKGKEESKKGKEESKKGKEESKKGKEESKKDKEESKKDKEESKKDKEESKKDKEESKKDKEESEKDKEESEKDKQEEEEESEKEKEESEKGKDKEEKACSSKCHSFSLLSDSSNSSPPCHRWTAEYKRSSTRDQDTERDGGRSERNRERYKGRSERNRDRRSSTRDQDRERDGGRSERDRDRHSSTRDQDRERDGGRSERNRDRHSSTRDQDRERDWGRSERNRDRRSSTRDQDRERDRGRSERNRDRRSSTRDQDRETDRDWGRSERNRERDRHSRSRELDRYRWWETERKIRSSTRDGDREWDRSRSERDRDRLSSTRGGSEKDGDGDRSERDKDRERWWERDKDWDGDKESFLGLYPYSNDPTHPHASLMATDSVQYMAYHGSRYASTFPPGCGFPPGTMFPGTVPPGTVPLAHCTSAPGTVPPCPLVQCPPYPLYPNCPPHYYNGTSETFFQPYTQATGNPQFTNMDVQVQDPDASLSIPKQDIETVWPRFVHPSMNQDSNTARLNRLSIKMQLKRQRYRINLINRRNIQELRQLKETHLVAAKVPPSEPGTKKVPEINAVPPVATKYSGAPNRTGFPNRKWRKGKILEEKESIFNQGLSMRNRAYMTRWKLRFAEAVAKSLEVPSEPEPKTEPEAEDKSSTEWQRLFADSVENVAATDLFALSEPEAEKKPDWETEQKRTDEEMKARLKKKLGEFNLKMKQKSTLLKEAPTEAPT